MRQKGKFRGWNEKNQKWIYGYYFVNRGLHFIVEDGIADPLASYEDFVVVPESVGEFTGFTNFRKQEIYEGDILTNYMFNYEIIFINGTFVLQRKIPSFNLFAFLVENNDGEVEIVGNSYQNPELLTAKSE